MNLFSCEEKIKSALTKYVKICTSSKRKNKQIGLREKFLNFCIKRYHQKSEKTTHGMGGRSANHLSYRRPVSRIYKELFHLNNKKEAKLKNE